MKKLALIGVAVVTLMSSAAMAQSVGIGVGPGGAGVYVDDGHPRYYDHDRYYRRSYDTYHHRDWRWRHHHHHHDRVYIERD